MPICITGMHRSGTSMIARMLNICGLDLGEKTKITLVSESNLRGYWEHFDFVNVDNKVLQALNSTWENPSPFKTGWLNTKDILILKQTAQTLISTRFKNPVLFGWKDPRASLIMPFWYSIHSEIKMVICLRHPYEVALSLKKRDGFSIEKGLHLWYLYNAKLLFYAYFGFGIVINFSDIFNNPKIEIERLAEYCGLQPNESQIASAVASITVENRHHWSESRSIGITTGGKPEMINSVYSLLKERSDRISETVPPSWWGRFLQPASPKINIELELMNALIGEGQTYIEAIKQSGTT